MTIAEYFRSKMNEQGMNNIQLAEVMGVDKTFISRIWIGKVGIGEKTFTRLCVALGLDEDKVREEYGDQIAPRGHGFRKSDKPKPISKPKKKASKKDMVLTQREENDAAELLINFMHMFVCELNEEGQRVVMAMMKMLTGIDAFNNHNNDQEDNDESTDHEIQVG